jgi:hypothetical protein
LLPTDQRFRKYQWVDVTVTKATDDSRAESFKLRPDGIRVISDPFASWKAKKDVVLPLRAPSLCSLVKQRDLQQYPTLGVFKPASITRLRIVPDDTPNWSQGELEMLQQSHLFVDSPKQQLEKIPFRFIYQFNCNESTCHGHNLMCTDWEIGEAFRKWRSEYGDTWEGKFRQKFEGEMIEKYDTHFLVGTVSSHPNR